MEVMELIKQAEGKVTENQEIRDMSKNCPNMKGGRQGDLYVIRCDSDDDIKELEDKFRCSTNDMWSDFTFGTEFEKRDTNQLADGSSKGSRHIFSGNGDVLFSKNGHPCAGGKIITNKGWTLTHPEHAHFKFPAGQFVFFFQLDVRKEREVQRVRD